MQDTLSVRGRVLGEGRAPGGAEDAPPQMAAREGTRRSEVPEHREAALASSWYTGKRLRGVRAAGVARTTDRDGARPPERRQRRQPAREPTDALPKLPQPNGYTEPRTRNENHKLAFPGDATVACLTLTQVIGVRISAREQSALSSRGLGRRPLTAVTRVRIPLGLIPKTLVLQGFFRCLRPVRAVALTNLSQNVDRIGDDAQ